MLLDDHLNGAWHFLHSGQEMLSENNLPYLRLLSARQAQRRLLYMVNIKSNPSWLLLIFQQCMQIFAWNFTWLLSNKTHTLSPSFVKICLNTTNMPSQTRQLPFLSVSSIAFTGSLLVALERPGLMAMRQRCTVLLMRFLLQLFTCAWSASFNSPVVLGFGWSLWYWHPRNDSPYVLV